MTWLTRKRLSRRHVLRGLGAAVSLPLLDAMVPAATALAQTAAQPKRRFGAVFIPNGAIMEQWTPSGTGTGFTMSSTLKPLEPFREKLVVVTNLTRANPGVVEGDHAISAAGWLSGAAPKRTEAEDVYNGVTVDQVVAKSIGQDTPFPSLELATTDFTGYVGACTSGFSCAYTNTISWSSPTTPLPMEINPRVLFERMFGRPGTEAERAARRVRDRSILDLVKEQATALQADLGSADRARLGDYLDNVREIERRIQRTEAYNRTQVESVNVPIGIPESFEDHLTLMYELLTVAYQSDLTRVFTFMTDRELSQRTYPGIGVTEQHHTVSHHGNDPENIRKVATINAYHVAQFARFLDRLKATPDGDGSLFDHSLIVYGGGMGNPNQHASDPLPLVAVGGGVGRGDRHIELVRRTPMGNLWLSVAQHFGADRTEFGVSTGTVDLF
jgi:hypothetical protein